MQNRHLKHEQVASKVKRLIQKRGIGVGGALPTENELSEMFQCSRGTVRRAMDTLVTEGVIRRKQGSGSYVTREFGIRPESYIGLVVPTLLNAEMLRFFHALTLSASERSHRVLLCADSVDSIVEREFLSDVERLRVAGIVKFPTLPDPPDFEMEIREQFRSLHLPCVIINDFWTDPRGFHHLCVDEAAEVEAAVEHLARIGHRRIAWADDFQLNPRLRALDHFRNSLEKLGLVFYDHHILSCMAYAPNRAEDFWPQHAPFPTAVVTPYEAIATRIVEALRPCGVRVPEDLSIVGLNGPPLNASLTLDLTCTMAPIPEMVAKTLEILLNNTPGYPLCQYVFPPQFHRGATSAPPARSKHS